jgi:RNA polymerase sigma-70 factor (ECF subfamily)
MCEFQYIRAMHGLSFLRIRKVPQLSFKELVNDYSAAVMKTAIRILRDAQKAQDVHQEVFLAILRRWHKYNGQTNWGAYLYRVTIRKAIEFAKKSKIQLPAEQHFDCPTTSERPDGPLRTAELQQKLTTCLAGFPKAQADVFVLARIEGLEYQKIAEILNCSRGTVRVHLHRALKRLAHELGDYLA